MRRLATAIVAIAILTTPGTAAATPYAVSTNADALNNAACVPGNCSLRQAFNAASANPDADTISVPAGNYLINVAFGAVTLNNTTATVIGSGTDATTLDGNNASRVMLITNGSNVTLKSLAVVRGLGVQFAGGIYVNGTNTVTLDDVIVSANRATTTVGGDYGFGGGITKNGPGTLKISNSQVTGNTADSGTTFGGGGGGIQSSATTEIVNSIVSGNTAKAGGGSFGSTGGGISMNGSVALTMTNSSVANNVAEGGTQEADGGGIYAASASVILVASTMSNNRSGDAGGNGSSGGAIRVNGANLTFTNSTVSNNKILGGFGDGGGSKVNGGVTTLNNSTFADNSAGTGNGGNIQASGGSIALTNSIITGGVATTGSNCSSASPFTVSGRNLESADTCHFAAGDLKNTDPQLGPLADNGGPTQTRALAATSPAIDQAIGCPPPATDQRGIPRPSLSACDIGAFEYVPPPPPSPLDNLAPGASKLSFKPTSFRPLPKGASIAAKKKRKAKRGSTVSYTLTEAATTTFTVEKKVRGRKKGRKCVTTRKRGKRCTTFKAVKGSFSHAGKAGSNSFKFSGRISNKKLKPGSYRLTGVPTDAAKNKGKPVTANFKIVR